MSPLLETSGVSNSGDKASGSLTGALVGRLLPKPSAWAGRVLQPNEFPRQPNG